MAEIIFPDSPGDGTTFFHEDTVCVYHGANNTWECRAISSETPQPPSALEINLATMAAVEERGYATQNWVSQNYALVEHHHDGYYAANNHVHAGLATEAYVNAQIANINIPTIPNDIPTRAEYNALVTTVMAAIAGQNNNNSGY